MRVKVVVGVFAPWPWVRRMGKEKWWDLPKCMSSSWIHEGYILDGYSPCNGEVSSLQFTNYFPSSFWKCEVNGEGWGLRPNSDEEMGSQPMIRWVHDPIEMKRWVQGPIKMRRWVHGPIEMKRWVHGPSWFNRMVHGPSWPMINKWVILGPTWPNCYTLTNVGPTRAQMGFIGPKSSNRMFTGPLGPIRGS